MLNGFQVFAVVNGDDGYVWYGTNSDEVEKAAGK